MSKPKQLSKKQVRTLWNDLLAPRCFGDGKTLGTSNCLAEGRCGLQETLDCYEKCLRNYIGQDFFKRRATWKIEGSMDKFLADGVYLNEGNRRGYSKALEQLEKIRYQVWLDKNEELRKTKSKKTVE